MFFVNANTILKAVSGVIIPPVLRLWNTVTSLWENTTDKWED
jgi:hypothetical protein